VLIQYLEIYLLISKILAKALSYFPAQSLIDFI
jgi:hypothetical protein